MSNTHSIDFESTSSQYAYVADTASLSIAQSFTIESWVNFESLPNDTFSRTIAGKIESSANKRSYWLAIRNTSGTYYLRTLFSTDGTYQGDNDKQVTWTPSTSTWYHVAVVYDHTAPNLKFYVGTTTGDDAQQGTTQTVTGTSIHNNDSRFHVGAINSVDGAEQFMDGLVDELRVWNVARSLADINSNKFKQLSSGTGLVAGYNFNNGYTDVTGNNNLTGVNTPVFSTNTVPLSTGSPTLFFAQY